ncbi:Fatty acid desaturase [Carpediemonas membranifera]|uniref:Fatty acid desaturase n=1 Tax=Carpediemonas membranifera TaxID=201153 RepID=A0A8J6E178_9EUKA|nr:Fatty acid desaturase [Carpediemonas membranifera]|eukprot:KAG9393128.1 Fatty acid desaturase [Carpediemonas membranifera]
MVRSKSIEERKAVQNVMATIRNAEKVLREQHPILNHQNAIAASILIFSMLGMVATGIGYYLGFLPALAVIPINCFLASLTHELEHDLIHKMYFKTSKALYAVMMMGVWIARPNTVNPWMRRDLHLHHHSTSGTPSDVEERILGNGMSWFTPLRALCTLDPTISAVVQTLSFRRIKGNKFTTGRLFVSGAPFLMLHDVVVYGWVLLTVLKATQGLPEALAQTYAVMSFLMVTWLGPNIMRHTILSFVSSNIHYYANEKSGEAIDSRVKQCQVLDTPLVWPLHLFCAAFGQTHGIHHYVPKQAWWVRTMIRKEATTAMIEAGVRHNDLGTFFRANRWPGSAKKEE